MNALSPLTPARSATAQYFATFTGLKWLVALVVGLLVVCVTQAAFARCGVGCSGVCYGDNDGDGYGSDISKCKATGCTCYPGMVPNSRDCDDGDAARNPGESEICDGKDNDCDGTVDEGGVCCSPSTEVCDGADNDCDGQVDENLTRSCGKNTGACSTGTSYCSGGSWGSCQGNVGPSSETCNGADDDCDGTTDEGVKNKYYRDADGDGYGGNDTTWACSRPSGYVTNSRDCDDTRSSINPSASESCNGVDDDCDGTADDGDPGGGANCSTGQAGVCSTGTTVCSSGSLVCSRDTDPTSETCDGRDNDCDGTVDDGVKTTYWADGDSDGYGGNSSTKACSRPSGYVANSDDCDDGNPSINPARSERCNGVDDDCDGQSDEGLRADKYYDADGDGYGSGSLVNVCSSHSDYVSNDDDCDDADAAISPAATEVCDTVDNDCDGATDEGVTTTYYADADGDSYGDAANTTQACSAPSGYVGNVDDCDDGNAGINPSASESCNGADDDCDGTTDEGVKSTYYTDMDGDGHGVAGSTTLACSAPSGYAAVAGDCDDGDAVTYPGAASNESSTACMTDADGDGYGDNKPRNGVVAGVDCDDAAGGIYPSATEVCDGADQDCDGAVDEYVKTQYFYDNDDDGYGTSTSMFACTSSGEFTATQDGDCHDGNASINPGNPGSCDGYSDPFSYAGQPAATFLLGGDIFASGQSNNLGPVANQVLDNYWIPGPCPDTDGDTDDCDQLLFGLSMYADNDCAASINPMVKGKEDGGAEVEDVLQGIQNRVGEAYCADASYRPIDDALYAHQALTFPGGSSADLATQADWWERPNLNFMVIGDLPQSYGGADDRVESSLQAACDLYRGNDGTGPGAVPPMPTWVMLSRTYDHQAVPFAGLLAAAGGTGQCCYGAGCDPADPDEQIDVCNHIAQSGVSEQTIRQDIADGKYNCGRGNYDYQSGGLDYGSDTGSGQLAATRCHLVGQAFNDNCYSNGRQPSDVLGSMACMRQLPLGVSADDVHIEYCIDLGSQWGDDDDDDDDGTRVCIELEKGDGLEFVNPPENTLFIITKEVFGISLCELMSEGVGDVDVTITECPRKGERCVKDGLEGRCAQGVIKCEQDGDEYCQTLYDPMPEVCNGLDDDCNGQTDNLSDSWDDFWTHQPEDLEASKYSDDGIERSAIHCHERNVCGCRGDRAFEHTGSNFEEYVKSWTDGICECGESLRPPAQNESPQWSLPMEKGAPSGPGVDSQAACSATAKGRSAGALGLWSLMLVGMGLWWRRRRR